MKKMKNVVALLLLLAAPFIMGVEKIFFSPDFTALVKPTSTQTLTREGDTTVLTIRTSSKNLTDLVSIPIDPALVAGKDVLLSAEVKQEDVSSSPRHWNGVKLMLDLTCADGKRNFPQAQNAPGTLPWQTRSIGVKLPADLKAAAIRLGLENVSGTVHFRNVRLVETTIPNYGNFTVTGAANHQNAEYKPGEEMVFTFRVLENDKPAGGRLKVIRSGDDGKTETVEQEVGAGEPCIIRTSLDQPGFVMVKAILLDLHGKPAKHRNGRNVQYGVAAGVNADMLKQGVPEPADFDAYWAKQKEKLSAVPLKVLERKLLKETAVSDIYDAKIACAGNRPVSGYLSIPKNSQPASLPLRLHYDGYSVRSAQIIESPDAINFFVNAHGIENNREKTYYDGLEKGELRSYGFQNKENLKPETCYFNHMILRDLRALEYARTLPEWNGKDIHIFGGSQGAFQAVAVTGLSDGITSCDIRIPWFCDLGGVKIGRVRGWRPDHAPGLDYFDTVNFAKRIKCPVNIFAGLSDWVCPPSGIWILYNNLGGSAKLTMEQGLDHAIYPGHQGRNAAQTSYSKSTQKPTLQSTGD